MSEGQALPQATFFHTNPLNISEIRTATKFYISMLQTSNLAVLHIFSCSFFFSIHKVTSLGWVGHVTHCCKRPITL